MGLPTVAFDTDMNREYLGEFGVYAKYKDSNDLATCIIQLLDSEEKRKELSPKIRERAIEKFGLANMATNTMVMYDDVIKNYRGK
jgi:glycosyltransferase involved in cell wall biosynthesis